MRAPLPIDAHVLEIVAHARERGAVVVVAAPGAGKTTRVPPALASEGPLILLQPRRVAARSIARRIALEQGWTLGEEVGWQVRYERRFTSRTRLLVSASWARLISKVFHVDPLTCAKCGGKLEIIAYLHDQVSISRILDHIGPWPARDRQVPAGAPRGDARAVDEEGREIEGP